MRSSIRRAVDAGFSAAWQTAFSWGANGRRPVTLWSSPGKQRVLVIAPHPDDEVAGCGGVILLHRAAGDEVTVLHVTDGRGSRLGKDPLEVARLRRAEAEASLAALGVDRWEWAGLSEWEWKEPDLAARLERLMADIAPQVIYAPSRVDFHPEHRRVAAVTGSALALPAHRDRTVRIYPVQVPLTPVLGNLVAPIGRVLPALLEAMRCYGSQEASLRAPLRMRRYAAKGYHLPGVVEEFWEMSGAAYSAIHAVSSPAASSHFRGLRRSALTDPLAYLAGGSERRRLFSLSLSAKK